MVENFRAMINFTFERDNHICNYKEVDNVTFEHKITFCGVSHNQISHSRLSDHFICHIHF